jgi:hypothetical protein
MTPLHHSPGRRKFLTAAATAFTAPLILPAGRLFGAEAASRQLNIAVIGCGSRASQVLLQNQPYTGVRFVAACDPFKDRAENFAKRLNEKYATDACKSYQDFRRVIDNREIDGVAVFTPDHWHVPVAMLAARGSKDMYVEKPLGVAMTWAWQLREEIQKNKVIFQYGTQQRSSRVFRQACDLVRNGYIGKINSVDVWCGHLAANQHVALKEAAVPENFDYNLWTGPSPHASYQPERVSNMGAWHCHHSALGFIAGWGAHPLDICQWGLDMDASGPVAYDGTGVLPAAADELYDTTRRWDIHCNYANGVKMRFMDTLTATPPVKAYHYLVRDHGTVFHGEEGWVGVDRMAMYSHDTNKLRKLEFRATDSHLPVSDNHFANFLDCMRSREQTISPFETALRSDTISHLSDIVVRTGAPLKWDPVSEKIIDGSDAQNAFLDRPMRDGFKM